MDPLRAPPYNVEWAAALLLPLVVSNPTNLLNSAQNISGLSHQSSFRSAILQAPLRAKYAVACGYSFTSNTSALIRTLPLSLESHIDCSIAKGILWQHHMAASWTLATNHHQQWPFLNPNTQDRANRSGGAATLFPRSLLPEGRPPLVSYHNSYTDT